MQPLNWDTASILPKDILTYRPEESNQITKCWHYPWATATPPEKKWPHQQLQYTTVVVWIILPTAGSLMDFSGCWEISDTTTKSVIVHWNCQKCDFFFFLHLAFRGALCFLLRWAAFHLSSLSYEAVRGLHLVFMLHTNSLETFSSDSGDCQE